MSLRLQITIPKAEISTHEVPTAECVLTNDGPAVELPGPYDRSGAFEAQLRGPDGAVLRRMNRQTRQRMLSDDRVDTTLETETLGTGEQWDWEVELASFHHPIPPGQFELGAQLSFAGGGVAATAEGQAITVREDPIRSVLTSRDNPILDSLTLLLEAETPEGRGFFLRQHNYGKPLGSWYSTRIPAPPDAGQPFLATAGFFQAESFDPAFQKWVVTRRGESGVEGYLFDEGVPVARRKGTLPAGATLLPSAFYSENGDLFLFLWAASGMLECHRLEAAGLSRVFEYKPLAKAGTMLAIGASEDSIHLAIPWRGIVYERLDRSGNLQERIQALRTGFRPLRLTFEPGLNRIKGLFVDGRQASAVQVAVVDLRAESASTYIWDRFPLRGGLREMSFDQDRGGRFHLLATTAERRLYYLSEGRGPVLVAEGEEKFHPVVCAPRKVYLGFSRKDIGFRFVQYQRRRHGKKLVGAEAHPAVG